MQSIDFLVMKIKNNFYRIIVFRYVLINQLKEQRSTNTLDKMARPKSAVSRSRTASALPKKDSFTRKQESLERLLEQDDDLEYSITFPSPAPAQDYVFVYQDDIEPVVYLLGWEGMI